MEVIVNFPLSIVNYLQSIVNCQLSINFCPLSKDRISTRGLEQAKVGNSWRIL